MRTRALFLALSATVLSVITPMTCWAQRSSAQAAALQKKAEAGYPFVGTRVISLTKRLHCGGVDITVHYPHFNNSGARDATETNQFFAHSAHQEAQQIELAASKEFNHPRPVGQSCPGTLPVGYELYQSFDLGRPGRYLLDVFKDIAFNTGAPHVQHIYSNYLIDLHTDQIVPLSQVFAPHSYWQTHLRKIASSDFKKRWPADLWYMVGSGKHLFTPTYFFGSHDMRATYNFGNAFGGVGVSIPYSQVRQLLRVNGPLETALRERVSSAPGRDGDVHEGSENDVSTKAPSGKKK